MNKQEAKEELKKTFCINFDHHKLPLIFCPTTYPKKNNTKICLHCKIIERIFEEMEE